MSGHVFHPDHHELHGVTVVLETAGAITYVGRFDTEDEAGVHLLNLAVHDADAGGPSLEEFLSRAQRFGVRAERKHLVVPRGVVARIRKLGDL